MSEPDPDYLDLEDLIEAATLALGRQPEVRDWGILEAALFRPMTSAFEDDAYPGLHRKAAALLHSLVTGHPLVDGNKRLGLTAMLLFYAYNGYRIDATDTEKFSLVMAVAEGQLQEVAEIADVLSAWVTDY